MSWDTEQKTKVYDRLVGDSTLTALTSRIYTSWPPEGTTMPYVVLTWDSGGTEESFTAKGINTILDVHVFAEKQYTAGDSHSTCSLILDRVEGNWLTNNRNPTYGLERWTPELSAAGWTASPYINTSPRLSSHEAGVWHFISTYETVISKTVTGP